MLQPHESNKTMKLILVFKDSHVTKTILIFMKKLSWLHKQIKAESYEIKNNFITYFPNNLWITHDPVRDSYIKCLEWYLHNLQIIQIPTFKVYHVQEYNFNNSKNSNLTWKQLIFCAQYMQRLKASTDMCFFFYIAQYSCKYLTNILTYSHWHYN